MFCLFHCENDSPEPSIRKGYSFDLELWKVQEQGNIFLLSVICTYIREIGSTVHWTSCTLCSLKALACADRIGTLFFYHKKTAIFSFPSSCFHWLHSLLWDGLCMSSVLVFSGTSKTTLNQCRHVHVSVTDVSEAMFKSLVAMCITSMVHCM